MTNSPSTAVSRPWVLAAWLMLGGYGLALAVGTHLPPATIEMATETVSDKALHAGAYFGFGLLAATAWRLTFGRFDRIAGTALLLMLTTLGLFDELTQPYFDRSCDAADWGADVVGAATGLVLFRIVLALMAMRRT